MNSTLHQHYILYKPFGFLSQFIYNKKRKKRLLGELYPFADGTMAIGRLDEDSEGLLLLSTDGMESERVRSKKVEKEYYVMVDGIITQEAVDALKQGVLIGLHGQKYKTKPCECRLLFDVSLPSTTQRIRDLRHGPVSWISITLTEGKFRQVRKMTAAVGFPTLRLARVRIGSIEIGNMQAGEVQEVGFLEI